MPKPRFGYEAGHSEGLRINFPHTGFFYVHSTGGIFAVTPVKMQLPQLEFNPVLSTE